MKALSEGQLVTVAEEGQVLDGIVFHVESFLKAVVAVPDGNGGAAFRTAHRKALTERTRPGEHDESLRKLIRRTPSRARTGARGGSGRGRGSRGHGRGADHRSTGR
jgi:hypothetical protein